MRFPAVILTLSLGGLAVAALLPGYNDLFLVFAPSAVAALLILLLALVKRRSRSRRWCLVDGSNVMYWQDGAPNWKPLKDVIATLRARGMTPAVVFDANAGYLLEGRYHHDYAMAKALGLETEQVMVVPKGQAADGFILQASRDFKASIITNDQYRDWAEVFPEIIGSDRLITGEYRNGAIRLSNHAWPP